MQGRDLGWFQIQELLLDLRVSFRSSCCAYSGPGPGGQHEPITGIRAGAQAGSQQLQVKLERELETLTLACLGYSPDTRGFSVQISKYLRALKIQYSQH